MKNAMKQVLACILCLFFLTSSYGQDVQWASKLKKISDEYDDHDYSGVQLLGSPNALPTGGDSEVAWATGSDNDGYEKPDEVYIKVLFDEPMKIRQVAIGESFNPGAISKVNILGGKKDELTVLERDVTNVTLEPRMLNIFFEETPFEVDALELWVQPGKVDGWNEIDCIGISPSTDSIKAKINLVEGWETFGEMENLGSKVNSEYSELQPVISPDGLVLYYDRKNHPGNTCGESDYDEIWYSILQSDGSWGSAQNIGSPLNNCDNNWVNAITPDGMRMLVNGVYAYGQGTTTSGVSISKFRRTGWFHPSAQKVDDYYNDNDYVSFFLSSDGNVLFQCVQRDDTYGDRDIYVSFRKKEDDNEWTKPLNLGPTINTAGTEDRPYLAADGRTMYFSSYGHPGYGSSDIYVSKRLDDSWTNWSTPKNMGPKINTSGYESGYSVPASGEYCYFSSTDNSFGNSDIVRVKLEGEEAKPDPVVLVYGRVLNQETEEPVSAEIIYNYLPEGDEAGVAYSNGNTGEYKIVLPKGSNFSYAAKAEGFYAISENLNLLELEEYAEIERDLYLAPIKVGTVVRLNNIFFEFGKATLMEASFMELDKVVLLMTDNPKLELEISGHTDDVGSESDNLKLSQNRAQAVVDYLTQNGIKSSRLIAKGYGESSPLIENDSDENRARNRRVEFKILNK